MYYIVHVHVLYCTYTCIILYMYMYYIVHVHVLYCTCTCIILYMYMYYIVHVHVHYLSDVELEYSSEYVRNLLT